MELQKEDQKIKLTEICELCHKPKSSKARSDVTRFLGLESRCNCLPANDSIDSQHDEQERPDGDQSNLPAAMTAEQVQANLGDKYEVLNLLGQGGMGVVYRVRDKELNKTFAIKVLNPSLVEDSQSVKRFQQEAKAATSLTHVNLAAVYDYGVGAQGAPYLVMDYLDGANLADLIRKEGYLDVPRALELFVQTAEAVASAHAKGVIHRDIKPNNIIVCKRDDIELVKLVDFGIAKVLPNENTNTRMTQTGEILGSPLYMSPEQCVGNPIDQRSDLYAFGCVMYEALTGVAPFAAENAIKTILKHVNDKPKGIRELPHDYGVPPALEEIIMHCLEKEPSERYQTAEDLLKDLKAFRAGQKTSLQANSQRQGKKFLRSKTQGANNIRLIGLTLFWLLLLGVFAWTIANANKPMMQPANHGGFTQGTTDKYTEADQLDSRSFALFNQGEYEKAADLLMFNLHTYKLDGNAQHEIYLADCTQHLAKCYMMMKDYPKAQKYYRDALKIYDKWAAKGWGTMMPEAVADYASVLKGLGETSAADAMLKDWQSSSRARGQQVLTTIP